ncbi:MAG: nucleoside triphosphate pyrophosphohydrolase [Candidatus Acididesulfobacter guangdongensis]|uniref:Nucleoside triphosphate pyrophosphohydrolase n=1 Tax=Acididesulfobacter guangdongensis TaxID=2597225 RepID=A0A519BI75_ACIG2|nr:MAG: nucleoside triphosphate pyrophosphohydrolase [Candidatus Acididesulfobacter guangdongensis]
MNQNNENNSDYNYKGFNGLVDILKQLRSENGCPWDKKQTEETLKPYVLEEAYEVAEALDSKDTDEISEELGDLLLQVVFLSQIYAEKKIFSIEDVITKINNKLLRRHPHVFDKTFSLKEGECLNDVILENWEKIKKQEKKEKKYKEKYKEENAISDSSVYVVKNMPALHRAYMVQEKASRQGFDFSSIGGALEKINEEANELRQEIENCRNDSIKIKNTKDHNAVLCANGNDADKIKEEYGDLLFSIVNVGRLLDLHPCDALNNASDKFIKRFNYIENKLSLIQNSDIKSADAAVLDKLWEEAKRYFSKMDDHPHSEQLD